ncbi:hypothetical protein CYMTET_39899 [Cymbomonas tetramitiformis]|uniref:Uncharacterized protein n=1 Tax=Cymbomonas tetramitiformis TaxID=36881 RepID=A0AAE0CA90_9CHLO|nr:hypothetical protein CYMTET_39899 [Cymbomonas tetramitiformis]
MVNAAEKKEEAKKEGESEFESEEEAKKEGDGEEEEEDEDDQEDEIEIHCAQPAAEDPEKKYTTFATDNGFESRQPAVNSVAAEQERTRQRQANQKCEEPQEQKCEVRHKQHSGSCKRKAQEEEHEIKKG